MKLYHITNSDINKIDPKHPRKFLFFDKDKKISDLRYDEQWGDKQYEIEVPDNLPLRILGKAFQENSLRYVSPEEYDAMELDEDSDLTELLTENTFADEMNELVNTLDDGQVGWEHDDLDPRDGETFNTRSVTLLRDYLRDIPWRKLRDRRTENILNTLKDLR